VARRIAHEIKNPLTPIQLSAERLKRKYGKEIVTDPEVFQQCTDTIVRQVGDIGRMVDEFSSFARMPVPVMRRENAQELIQQAVFLQRVAHPQITFETSAPSEAGQVRMRRQAVSQALTNVLKNAGEGRSPRAMPSGDDEAGTHRMIALDANGERVTFRVTTTASACRRNIVTGSRALCHHARQRHGPRAGHRAQDHGRPWRRNRPVGRGGGRGGAEVRLTFPIRKKACEKQKGVSEDEQERIADRV
jgi:two-component system, NtrC family, nitrogen regulation sensor histidine kinase NtrY